MNLEGIEQLDLRGVPCPANSAKILVTLAMMDTGQLLEVWLDDGEPIENVPPAIEAANYRVVDKRQTPTHWVLTVEA